MGPCSLLAIKEGEIQHKYDTAFTFAEVNADTIYWRKNKEDGKFEAVHRRRDAVGKNSSHIILCSAILIKLFMALLL